MELRFEASILAAMLDTVRAFVALNLEMASTRRIIALQRGLRASPELPSAQVAWVAAPNLHLGLRALGSMDAALTPALADGMREALRTLPPIRIPLVGPAAYPSESEARLVVVEPAQIPDALRNIGERIEALVQSIGFAPETRPFRPHIVLARTSTAVAVSRWFASLGRVDLPEAQATECVVFEQKAVPAAEYPALIRVGLSNPTSHRSQRPRPSQRSRARSKPPAAGAQDSSTTIPSPPKVPSDLDISPGSDVDAVKSDDA